MKFTNLLVLTLLLTGCARKEDPVSSINDDIQQGVVELVDYANNNMEMDADKQLLLNGAVACASKANALTKAHEASISACDAETDKVKAERNMLALILIAAVLMKLRKFFI